MRVKFSLLLPVLTGALWAATPAFEVTRELTHALGPESDAARAERHRLVAARRVGPAIIVHRGASAFAPENTLEAYAAAMDYGADGCEIDLRRTRDGVLAMFHDDALDRVTEGFGAVRQVDFHDLATLAPVRAFGRAQFGDPPTFAAVLELARERAMLLHLDIKEPGLEDEIVTRLDAADAWDHVVAVNEANAAAVRRHPQLRLLAYKTSGLYEGRLDLDPATVASALAQPGELLLVDDPRVSARALGRPAYQPRLLTKTLRVTARPVNSSPASPSGTNAFEPFAHARAFAARWERASVEDLCAELERAFPEAGLLDPEPGVQRRRAERIVERAWAAQRLGVRGVKSERVVAALERTVRARTRHGDWLVHGLDGAMAARALGRLGADAAIPVLAEALRRVAPELADGRGPAVQGVPVSWADYRVKQAALHALGELEHRAAERVLFEYVSLPVAEARAWGPPQFEDATRALFQQRLGRGDLRTLLEHPNPAVRGTAIFACLDRLTQEREVALKRAAPWALVLPRAHRGRAPAAPPRRW